MAIAEKGGPADLVIPRAIERVPQLRHRLPVQQQTGCLNGRDLHFLIQIAEQENDTRAGAEVTDFLQGDQRFV